MELLCWSTESSKPQIFCITRSDTVRHNALAGVLVYEKDCSKRCGGEGTAKAIVANRALFARTVTDAIRMLAGVVCGQDEGVGAF